MLETLPECKPDKILALMAEFRADPRDRKIDLGVGVYKDETGATPIMRAVRKAEVLLHEQQDTKSYVGPAGDLEFNRLLGELVLGDQFDTQRYAAIQAPGGCGAIRILMEMIARANPSATCWVSDPTWPIHLDIVNGVRLKPGAYTYFNREDQSVDFDGMLKSLEAAQPGDVLLLHGCCHNPTGADLTITQWEELTRFVQQKQILPFIDLAYMGFGDGIEEDTAGLRHMVAHLEEVLVAVSCSKNFAIYRERTGCAMVMGKPEIRDTLVDTMKGIGRSNHSMPPDHGAALVRLILSDPQLRAEWLDELTQMRNRLNTLRQELASILQSKTGSDRFSYLANQKGMFSISGATEPQTQAIKNKHGIYVVADGRINIAGLPGDEMEFIADAMLEVGM